MTFNEYIQNHKFENVEDLASFLKAHSIYTTKETNFCVDRCVVEMLQKNKSVWFEYACCEHTSRAGYTYDVPSWYIGVYGYNEELYIFYEQIAYGYENENENEYFSKGLYQLLKE